MPAAEMVLARCGMPASERACAHRVPAQEGLFLPKFLVAGGVVGRRRLRAATCAVAVCTPLCPSRRCARANGCCRTTCEAIELHRRLDVRSISQVHCKELQCSRCVAPLRFAAC